MAPRGFGHTGQRHGSVGAKAQETRLNGKFDLAGYGTRIKLNAGCGMTEIRWPRAGCEIRILPREWNFPILIDEMQLRFKIDVGTWDKKPENQTYYVRYEVNCNIKQVGSGETFCLWRA